MLLLLLLTWVSELGWGEASIGIYVCETVYVSVFVSCVFVDHISAASQTPTQHCLEIPPMCLLPQCTQWLHIPILLHQCSQKQLTEPRPRSCVLMIYLSKPLHPPFRRKSLAPRCQLHPLPVNSWARLAMKTRIFFHSLSNVYYPRFTKKRPSHSELRRQRALEKRKNWNFSFCLLLSLLTPPPPNQPPTPSWQATIFVLMGY